MPRSEGHPQQVLRVLVTGAHGFIGKNLCVKLKELHGFHLLTFVRGDGSEHLRQLLIGTDAVIHLAGENRPTRESAYSEVNVDLTFSICEEIRRIMTEEGRKIPIVFASSVQAERDNPYGRSKLAAEEAVRRLSDTSGVPATIFRLPGVFGKWCRPNYNSVVATFCYNLARGLAIRVDDPEVMLRLAYIDDVTEALISATSETESKLRWGAVTPEYQLTLGELEQQIRAFGECRASLVIERVGSGFTRKLYSTYVSYLPPEKFAYEVPQHSDSRGSFVEMLKTQDSGQISYFTAHPGVVRGGHYHHTKTEKFLVVKGEARFRFRHLVTGETVEFNTRGSKPEVVDTIPGWSHDITNTGDDELVVLLWANENFDRQRPDTVASKV
jgi:UDP-2-acetamido-2,6-beta-L-arabino-hexul-4-ose reductase